MKRMTSLRLALGVPTLFLGVLQFGAPRAIAQYSFTSLQVPGEACTIPLGFSEGRIFGISYETPAKALAHGFIYDGVNFMPLNPPAGLPGKGGVTGLDGQVQVGSYITGSFASHGYIYDGSTLTLLDDPLADTVFGSGTHPTAVLNGEVVGCYATDASHLHGFTFKGGKYVTIDVPGASQTVPTALDGNNVAGYCDIDGPFGSVNSGFIYDGTHFAIVNDPLSDGWTHIGGISGGTVVGYYNVVVGHLSVASRGFVCDGKNFITVDGPTSDVLSSEVTGISGNTIVGDYTDHYGAVHGFIGTPTVPEPGGIGIGLGVMLLLRTRRSLK